ADRRHARVLLVEDEPHPWARHMMLREPGAPFLATSDVERDEVRRHVSACEARADIMRRGTAADLGRDRLLTARTATRRTVSRSPWLLSYELRDTCPNDLKDT